jgi:hypothetical protein
MKNLTLTVGVLLALSESVLPAQTPTSPWLNDLATAVKEAKSSGKPIFAVLY